MVGDFDNFTFAGEGVQLNMNKDKFNMAFIIVLALLGVGCFIMEYTFGFKEWHIYGLGFLTTIMVIGCLEFMMGLKNEGKK